MSNRIPKYRKQKHSNGDIAFVELNGQRFYLGKYNSHPSKQKYHQLLAEWSEAGNVLPVNRDVITIIELIDRYWTHAQNHYRKPDGTPTSELGNIILALKPLKKLYGMLPVSEFGPLKLKAVRQQMISMAWARGNINCMIGRIRRVFKWGVENELVPPDVLHGLQAVTGLQRGRCDAKEREPIKPVVETYIYAIEPYVSRQVWALVQLQLHTAARSGELVGIRAVDIDTSGNVWTFTPADHKTAHHGHQRTIYFGPKAQGILKEFMADRPVDAYLFNPREAVVEQAAKAKTHRRPDQKPNKRKTQRAVRECYDRNSYRRAIQRACKRADVPAWHPHQLRHNSGTFIRREYGIEAAQVMLGHARADVTQIYAEVNREKALEIAAKIG